MGYETPPTMENKGNDEGEEKAKAAIEKLRRTVAERNSTSPEVVTDPYGDLLPEEVEETTVQRLKRTLEDQGVLNIGKPIDGGKKAKFNEYDEIIEGDTPEEDKWETSKDGTTEVKSTIRPDGTIHFDYRKKEEDGK